MSKQVWKVGDLAVSAWRPITLEIVGRKPHGKLLAVQLGSTSRNPFIIQTRELNRADLWRKTIPQ